MTNYATVLTIVIRPCLLGFDIQTYNVRVYEGGFTQGQGFIRDHGIVNAHQMIYDLIWTAEPFRIILK